jgi:hypothetical protein
MHRTRTVKIMATLTLALGLGATPAAAGMIWDSWPVLDADSDGDCQLEILGNGKFMLIRAQGLGPAEQGRFEVTNPQMKPVDWRVISDTKGVFVRAFLPNLWNRGDGTIRDRQNSGVVTASVTMNHCSVTASAPWKTGIRVIP